MGELMAATDWTRTPLGPVDEWPASLRTSLDICLRSRFPILVWWGDDLVMLYNDAYRSILGGKHPRAMGQPASNVWTEIWVQSVPRLASPMWGVPDRAMSRPGLADSMSPGRWEDLMFDDTPAARVRSSKRRASTWSTTSIRWDIRW